MNEIRVPSVASVVAVRQDVNRLQRDMTVVEPQSASRNKRSQTSLFVVANEVGTAAEGEGIDTVSTLFEVEVVKRVYQEEKKYGLERTGIKHLCFNDFGDDVEEGTMLKIDKDRDTPYYHIIVWYCG